MTLHSLPLFELKSEPQGLVSGYASVFGGVDSYGDSIVPGAFKASLAHHRAAGTAPAMLWAHRQEQPIGRWSSLAEDSRGLHVEGQINLKTGAGRDAFEHLRAGDLNGLSIGYQVAPGGSERRNDGVNLLKAVNLYEVSTVAIPADSAARIVSVKSQRIKPATLRSLEQALEQIGLSRREARAVAAKGWSGLAASPDDDDSRELIAAFKAATQTFME